jgi:hypothetical protein
LGERGLKFLPAGVVKSENYHPFSVSINTPPAKNWAQYTSPWKITIFGNFQSLYIKLPEDLLHLSFDMLESAFPKDSLNSLTELQPVSCRFSHLKTTAKIG